VKRATTWTPPLLANDPGAQICPQCGQQFKSIDSVDLTYLDNEESPSHPTPRPARRKERLLLSSTTIPSARSASVRPGYERAPLDAIQNHQESIANTRRKDPIAINIQALFWFTSGAYEMVDDIRIIEYHMPPRLAGKTMGNFQLRPISTSRLMTRWCVIWSSN
jgi:hypothetical protein